MVKMLVEFEFGHEALGPGGVRRLESGFIQGVLEPQA